MIYWHGCGVHCQFIQGMFGLCDLHSFLFIVIVKNKRINSHYIFVHLGRVCWWVVVMKFICACGFWGALFNFLLVTYWECEVCVFWLKKKTYLFYYVVFIKLESLHWHSASLFIGISRSVETTWSHLRFPLE